MTRTRRALLPAASLLAVVSIGLALSIARAEEKPRREPRPANWAQPLTRNGLPNLYKVTDDLYRGAQPTAEGMKELKAMGIKTVINLRDRHSDKELIGDTGLASESIHLKAWDSPEKEELLHFLRIVTDKTRAPVFVHCEVGADRTGVMCAMYRIVVCDWSKEETLKEMREGGFGFHGIWKNLPHFIKELDVDAIKKELASGERKKE